MTLIDNFETILWIHYLGAFNMDPKLKDQG